MRATVPVIAAGLLILVSALSLGNVAATHWALSDVGADRSIARTYEPDHTQVYLPPVALHGLVNKVTFEGRPSGDGGRFLDARVSMRAGAQAGTDVHGGDITYAVISRHDVILPGNQHHSAWYGEWNDFANPGVIDDLPDDASQRDTLDGILPPIAAADEFKWRGKSSGHPNLAITTFITPQPRGDNRVGVMSPGLIDQTDTADAGWYGAVSLRFDQPLLSYFYVVTVAEATPITGGGGVSVQLDDPNALYDVDLYEAVSSDLESLWLAISPSIPTTNDVLAIVATLTPTASALAASTQSSISSPYPREPNTIEDDYGGHATFGGVGDALGSYNDYAGYREGYHLYVDARPILAATASAYASVPGTPVQTGQNVATLDLAYDPHGVLLKDDERTGGVFFSFKADVVAWYDKNADGHLQAVCDPQSTDYDAERGYCTNAPRPWPHKDAGNEVSTSVCGASDARSSPVLVTPVAGASWPPGTLLVSDWHEPGRTSMVTDSKPLLGSETAGLSWRGVCPLRSTLDAILLPGGTTVPLRTEYTVTIGLFQDAASGINLVNERVRDMDVLAASL